MNLKLFSLYALVLMMGACATPQNGIQYPDVVSAPPPPAAVVEDGSDMNYSKIMTSGNVIVYPVTGDIDQPQKGFEQDRNQGGYVGFDPSVTVYSAQGGNQKPSFMPDYAVPKFAADYRNKQLNQQAAIPPLPLMPIDDIPAPRSLTAYDYPSDTYVAPVIEQHVVTPPHDFAIGKRERRSPPILTAYE